MGGVGSTFMIYPVLHFDFSNKSSIPLSGINGIKLSRTVITDYYINDQSVLVSAVNNRLRFTVGGLYIEDSATNLLPYSQHSGLGWSVSGNDYTQSISLSAGQYVLSSILMQTGGIPTSTFDVSGGDTLSDELTSDPTFYYGDYVCKRVYRTLFLTGTTTITITIALSGEETFDFTQVETGMFPSTPILTNGSSASRNADIVYMDVNQSLSTNQFNPLEGTFLNVGLHNYLLSQETNLHLVDPTSNDYLKIDSNGLSGFELEATVNGGFSNYKFFASCDNPGFNGYACAMSYRNGLQLASLNGRSPIFPTYAQANTFDFTHVNKIYIGSENGTTNFYKGIMKTLSYYKIFFSQNNLNSLTL